MSLVTVTHKFVSARPDGVDVGKVRPSNWNDTHAVDETVLQAALDALTAADVAINAAITAVSAAKADKSITLTAGTGLTGGGDLSVNRSFALDTTNTRNVDHAGVSVIAGAGLTGGGAITATVTLNIGAGLGIVVNADDVAVSVKLGQFHSLAATANRLIGQDGAGAPTLVTMPAAGLTLSAGAIALANDLAALEALAGTGIARRTGTDAWSVGTTVSTAEITANAVTNTILADMTQGTFKMRAAGAGTGDPIDGTGAQAAAALAAATTSAQGAVELATAAEYRANTAGALALTPAEVWSAMAEVTLTDAATVAVDWATGFDFVVTLAGNRTLGNGSNLKVGQKGRIRVVQDATGSRTLAYASDYEFASGTAIVLSIAANAQDIIYYDVIASGRVLLTTGGKAIS